MNTDHGISALVVDDHELIVIGIKTVLKIVTLTSTVLTAPRITKRR